METAARKRQAIFARPDTPRSMRITPRSLALMENIARLRLASTTQLAGLDGGSEQNVSRTLLALYEHGYVERPRAQISNRLVGEGSRSLVYGLTRKGAALLRANGHDVRRRLLDGIDRERGAGWRFIEHSIAITEFKVSLELAAKARPDLRILRPGEILEDAPKTKRDREVKLEASIRIGGVLKKNAVIPDALFGLRFNESDESYFMVEVDRGEMPVERYKSPFRTYFSKKILTYHEANRQQRHIHDLGLPHFRVLTITTTPERVEKMLCALEEITQGKGSSMFLFADQEMLAGKNPLELEWISGKRQKVKLTD